MLITSSGWTAFYITGGGRVRRTGVRAIWQNAPQMPDSDPTEPRPTRRLSGIAASLWVVLVVALYLGVQLLGLRVVP